MRSWKLVSEPTRKLVNTGLASTAQKAQGAPMDKLDYPPGWDEDRVARVLDHYEIQSEDEAVAEDEAAYESTTDTTMGVPIELVPIIREMIARRGTG
jgi:hypothetical protein